MIFMLFFWIALIVGVIYVVRWAIPSTGFNVQNPRLEASAIEVLMRRYASGEIDRQEYEQMRRDILQ